MRRGLVGMAALCALAVAGCGGSSHHASTTSPSSGGGGTAQASATKVVHIRLAASTTPVTTSIPTTPIATEPSSIPGVTLDLFSAQRTQGGAVVVVFGLTFPGNYSDGISSLDDALSANGSSLSATVSGVSLVDPKGLKEYQTYMSDPTKDATCLCSTIQSPDGAGTSDYAALIAAPPASVTSVSFVTGLGTFGNVTLTS